VSAEPTATQPEIVWRASINISDYRATLERGKVTARGPKRVTVRWSWSDGARFDERISVARFVYGRDVFSTESEAMRGAIDILYSHIDYHTRERQKCMTALDALRQQIDERKEI
jgi:hypothetical protein